MNSSVNIALYVVTGVAAHTYIELRPAVFNITAEVPRVKETKQEEE